MSSKMFMYLFLQLKRKVFDENIPGFVSIYWTSMDSKRLKVKITVCVASQGYKWYQTMNRGLI